VSSQRLLIFALVAVSIGLSWFVARRGSVGPMPLAECLTHGDCQRSERCVVVPKGDGFASYGQCGEPCVDDAACPNGWTCRGWVDEKGYLSPEKGRPADLPRVMACAHHKVE
jgi:hypothetical protein